MAVQIWAVKVNDLKREPNFTGLQSIRVQRGGKDNNFSGSRIFQQKQIKRFPAQKGLWLQWSTLLKNNIFNFIQVLGQIKNQTNSLIQKRKPGTFTSLLVDNFQCVEIVPVLKFHLSQTAFIVPCSLKSFQTDWKISSWPGKFWDGLFLCHWYIILNEIGIYLPIYIHPLVNREKSVHYADSKRRRYFDK